MGKDRPLMAVAVSILIRVRGVMGREIEGGKGGGRCSSAC
jgi:hypothetical protein